MKGHELTRLVNSYIHLYFVVYFRIYSLYVILYHRNVRKTTHLKELFQTSSYFQLENPLNNLGTHD